MSRSHHCAQRLLTCLATLSLLLVTACATPAATESVAPAQTPAIAEVAATPTLEPTEPVSTAEPEPTPPEPTATAESLPPATATAQPTQTPEPTPTEVALEPFDAELAATLQAILDSTVADGYIPGAVLSVSLAGHQPWTGSSGVADRQQGRPMEPDTNVRIASISKIFTSVVVLQLAEEGVIDLDAPLSAYVPDLLASGDQMRVRDLLQHTTGLYDYLEDRNYAARAYQDPQRVFEPRELVNYAAQFPLTFPPGSEGNWDYASTNYVILGIIVEQATGNSLAVEMRQRIFEPLGLAGTFFTPDEAVPESAARGYSQGADQTNVAMSFAFATASIVSTAADVRRFMEAVVGGELLGPEMQQQMFTFVNGKGQYNMPALEYGLGLMRNRLPVGESRPPEASTAVGHIGGFGGFRSATWATEDGAIAIALGVNQASTDPNTLATRVWDAILTHQGR